MRKTSMKSTSVRQSCSETTNTHDKAPIASAIKRCSLGSLPISTTKQQAEKRKDVWRSPGNCEIPDLHGKIYLQPLAVVELPKPVKKEPAHAPTRPPWIPACGRNWTPLPPAPVVRSDEHAFEKRLKKAVPKLSLISTPISRYSGSKEIGTGVNGSVIQIVIRGTKSRLALKRCKLDSDREYRAAIVCELKIMASGHANLIKLREAAVYRNEVWMAMDLMRCSVFAILCCRGIPEEHAVYIIRETLNALGFLHSKGFIHRDVKCENLLVGANGEIKLADFGLATSTKKVNRERLGTAKWMAPEVIREQAYNEKVDLWSLGITLIEMMDRVPPHYSTKKDDAVFDKILQEPSPTFTYSYPTIYCTGLVAWLLDENPDSRPSANDAAKELDFHVEQKLLKTTTAKELASFIDKTMTAQGSR